MSVLQNKLYRFLFTAALTIAFAACKDKQAPEPERSGSLQVQFEHVVNGQPLVLNDASYTNANGDAFTVSSFKYYISNIRLKRADGTEYAQPESYYLLDQAAPATQTLTLENVPAGEYTGMSFLLGVDSTRNVSGAQTGALDPTHGMFWTWNSGYIFLKLEGTSPQSADGFLTFHIGGFKSPHNTIRTIAPAFGSQKFTVGKSHTPAITLRTDVAALFTGLHQIKFSELPATMGGPTAVLVADNYARMITLHQLQP